MDLLFSIVFTLRTIPYSSFKLIGININTKNIQIKQFNNVKDL